MHYFTSDYTQGAAPQILQALTRTNMEQTPGYGEDAYCAQAAQKIRQACDCAHADVHFLEGGTQTNLIVISAALRPWQGVLCADCGHIAVHETGSIEACGHKVLTLPASAGKITAQQIEQAVKAHRSDENHEHMVQPGMVYLSQPTEYGTLYSLAQLTEIAAVCKENGLLLYVDGARLGYGMAAPGNDVFLPQLSRLCDAFYIGGTKVGALFGEALVVCNDLIKKDLRYNIKQKGGMLAKGRLLGIQFDCLFTDDLYTQLSRHAVTLALQIRGELERLGVPFLLYSNTNQQFPILEDDVYEKLCRCQGVAFWEKPDAGHTAVRICTCWATPPQAVQEFLADFGRIWAETKNSRA